MMSRQNVPNCRPMKRWLVLGCGGSLPESFTPVFRVSGSRKRLFKSRDPDNRCPFPKSGANILPSQGPEGVRQVSARVAQIAAALKPCGRSRVTNGTSIAAVAQCYMRGEAAELSPNLMLLRNQPLGLSL